MTRGMVQMTNKELDILSNVAVNSGCEKQSLIVKLSPVRGEESDHISDILISEDEAEIILDCLPIPDKDDNPSLVSARIKIHEFIEKSRFGN